MYLLLYLNLQVQCVWLRSKTWTLSSGPRWIFCYVHVLTQLYVSDPQLGLEQILEATIHLIVDLNPK